MATVYLPDEDHIVRHVPSTLVERDPVTNEIRGCFPQAFALRQNEEYLSASWLEHFAGSRDDRIKSTVAAFSAIRSVKPRQAFAIGNVAQIKDACAEYRLKVRVCHEPNDNPAYTTVRRYKSDEIELLELLAAEAWADVVEAKSYL